MSVPQLLHLPSAGETPCYKNRAIGVPGEASFMGSTERPCQSGVLLARCERADSGKAPSLPEAQLLPPGSKGGDSTTVGHMSLTDALQWLVTREQGPGLSPA